MSPARKRIVVAVAGEDLRALMRFVTEEALRTDSDLHFVHVPHLAPGLSGSFESDWQNALGIGHLVLDRASCAARERVAGKVAVTQELVEVSRGTVTDIVTCADGASLVALQHRHLTGLRRLTNTSTTHGVASRSRAPVVSVPDSWQPEPRHDRVTVAIHDPHGADHALQKALELAEQRDARLLVVHAWWQADGPERAENEALDDADTGFRRRLAPHLDALHREHPDVEVEIRVCHAPIESAILSAAESSDLVVLGRRHPHLPLGGHLGPVSRLVLRTCAVPVVLVEAATPVR
ncbi:universal stress protein [Nocardioides jensenii]|uniref:universal stress protein n=1 Tax=Nocardioides jensenii TaxID=1843 RepID=UPI0008318B8E|nr:universal stress protein [Nocardioides jensenii]